LLPEFTSPNFLASSALRSDYQHQAKSIVDANVMLFDSNCLFKPKINKTSREILQCQSRANPN